MIYGYTLYTMVPVAALVFLITQMYTYSSCAKFQDSCSSLPKQGSCAYTCGSTDYSLDYVLSNNQSCVKSNCKGSVEFNICKDVPCGNQQGVMVCANGTTPLLRHGKVMVYRDRELDIESLVFRSLLEVDLATVTVVLNRAGNVSCSLNSKNTCGIAVYNTNVTITPHYPSPPPALSPGGIVGIVFGGLIVVIVLSVVIGLLCCWGRRHQQYGIIKNTV